MPRNLPAFVILVSFATFAQSASQHGPDCEKTARDLWHQLYLVTFFKKSGGSVQAIVVHDASTKECSMSGVQVFVVAKRLD